MGNCLDCGKDIPDSTTFCDEHAYQPLSGTKIDSGRPGSGGKEGDQPGGGGYGYPDDGGCGESGDPPSSGGGGDGGPGFG